MDGEEVEPVALTRHTSEDVGCLGHWHPQKSNAELWFQPGQKGGIALHIQFDTPHQYVFIHEHVRHLLLLWPKEEKAQLFVAEWKDGTLWLRYPGETYTETVWDQVEPFFFQRLKTEDREVHAVLGATFRHDNRVYAMYYNRDHPEDDLYFFEVRSQRLHEIPDEEYANVVQAFLLEYPEYMEKEA